MITHKCPRLLLLCFTAMLCTFVYAMSLYAQDSTATDTTHARQDTLWRAPNEPPDPAKVTFINHFSYQLDSLSRSEAEKVVEATLNADSIWADPPVHVLEKSIVQSSFLNISEKIKDYAYHIVMLIFSVELTESKKGVRVAWNYGLCQAPYKSRHWIYGNIPFEVQQQAENLTETLFRKFIEMAKAKTATANKKGMP